MRTSIYLFLLVVGLGALVAVQAGDLEPPGPPGSTMVSLQQIYDKLDDCAGGGMCGVQKTGQTDCWDASGTPIDCAGTGQDGEHQTGYSVDPRFTDNLNGTVTDSLTGLIWLKDADCFEDRNWTQALSDANGLSNGFCGLTDGSTVGQWRLPNIKELLSIVDFSQEDPALPSSHPFLGVAWSKKFWSSTSFQDYENQSHYLSIYVGWINASTKGVLHDVWPVRVGD
jgi:hypothetical protein